MKLAEISREFIEPVHAVPAVMIVLLLLLMIGSLFGSVVLSLLLAFAGAYMVLIMAAGAAAAMKISDVKALFVVPCLLFLQHMAYGAGFLKSMAENLFAGKVRPAGRGGADRIL